VDVDGCPLPEDRLYDLENGVWVQPESDGTIRLGLMASFAAFIGRVNAVTYRPAELALTPGRSVGMLESIRFTGAVRTPVAGTVVEQNRAIADRPKLINDSPYDRGWLVRLQPEAPVREGPTLQSASAIVERLHAEIEAKRIRCFPAVPDVDLIEIGAECAAVLAKLDETLAPRPPGTVVLLVTDDPTSPIEMVRWQDRTGNEVLHHRLEGTLHHFLVRRTERPRPAKGRGTT
jgi:glycine cleavage system H protein